VGFLPRILEREVDVVDDVCEVGVIFEMWGGFLRSECGIEEEGAKQSANQKHAESHNQ